MMISYPGLSKLKTDRVVYQDVLLASDLGTLEQLKELSSKRKAIADSINGRSSVTEAIAREMSGGLTSRYEQDIQKLERYLPLLENLVENFNLKTDHWKQRRCMDLNIKWTSVLAPSIFQSSNIVGTIYRFTNLYSELRMTLSLYAALLHERPLEVLSSDLVQSATLFREAAGVYNYLAEKVVVKYLSYGHMHSPSEVIPSVCNIMSLVCLAEAQAVTARKAEENGNSGALVAKLHSGVKEFLVEAINISQSAAKNYVSSRLLDFMTSGKTLHELMSYKYLVESLKNDGKIGIAIGVLRWALANAKKYTPKEESWKLVSKQMIDDTTTMLQKYERENECVWCEKIASSNDDLPSPQVTRIVRLIPYQPQKLERKLVFKH